MSGKYRYEEFTWPEIREAVAQNRVCVLPVGTVEQHGPHLPLVTDVLTATEMSRAAVRQIPEEAVLMPSVYYAFNEHHLDFPGTIAVEGNTFINYITDIGKSLAHHGFRKILLVNGHGSNVPFLDATTLVTWSGWAVRAGWPRRLARRRALNTPHLTRGAASSAPWRWSPAGNSPTSTSQKCLQPAATLRRPL